MKVLKTLLVDDERLSLQMMKGIIDWGSFGIEIADTAMDGMEALDKFIKLSPGLIITDIRMPRLNGLEFIKKVREINDQTEILLISAYADFGYVKEAISLGCANYLLKPVDETELQKTLQAIVSKIASRDISRRLVDKSEAMKKRQILREYMKTGFRSVKALELLKDMGAPPMALMDVKLQHETINEYSGVKSIAADQLGYIQESMEEIASKSCRSLAFELDNYSFTVLAATLDMRILQNIAQEILHFLKNELGLTAMACISRIAYREEDLPALYAQTLKLNKYGQFLRRTDVLGYGLNCSEDEVEKASFTEHLKDLELALNQRNAGEASRILREVLDEAVRMGPRDLGKVYDFCFEAVLKARSLIMAGENASNNSRLTDITYQQVAANDSMDALLNFMTHVFSAVCRVEKGEKGRYSRLVESSITFLNKHYARNISLEEICTYLSVSRNYFSSLFKRDTGISLWAYLTAIRMGKARELLRDTDLRSHEIAYSVGYDNPSYFSKLFKKLHNQTPNEFRAESREGRESR
jgi:two-component system response regulator YesN